MTGGLESRLLRVEEALGLKGSIERHVALDAELVRITAEFLREHGGDEAAVFELLTEAMGAPDLGVDREWAVAYARKLLESARS